MTSKPSPPLLFLLLDLRKFGCSGMDIQDVPSFTEPSRNRYDVTRLPVLPLRLGVNIYHNAAHIDVSE
ncbi:hypothetical protein PNOK_0424700 [Pyrrhoderma noxium]|uniref:Uncharacterized protein n=1 Tax=Pyrrhoderma noxium TaxID=2282107 RepID=A0A286UI76_9AGAM|nr:hypothetical protein PNOK_0424700 [Pyrrhoderma noxium]